MKREIIRGLIFGTLAFFLLVRPLLNLMLWAEKESWKPKEPTVIYVEGRL